MKSGWPINKDDISSALQIYYPFRDELSYGEGLIFKGSQVLIPSSLRPKMIERIHCDHAGIESSFRRTKDSIFWPNMRNDIKQKIQTCEACNKYQRRQQKEPLISIPLPNRPWEKVGMDLFSIENKNYLIITDYYSNFLEINKLMNTNASSIIEICKNHFARYGIPEIVISDCGP